MSSHLHNVQAAGSFKSSLRGGQHICISTWDAPVLFNFPVSRFLLIFNTFWQSFKRYYQYFDLNWIDWPLIRSNLIRAGRKHQLYSGRILVEFSKTLVWVLISLELILWSAIQAGFWSKWILTESGSNLIVYGAQFNRPSEEVWRQSQDSFR